MVYINARCKEILSMLLKGKDYISLKQIAEEIGISKRSIYYDICKLNEWLVYYNLPELEVVRGKGIRITEELARDIERIVEGAHNEERYIFSPTERIQVIYCYILISHLSENVYIEQLSEYCGVSRNTIFNDLRVLVNQLKEYNLTLEYTTKRGYKIGGDVVGIRAMFFMYFNDLRPLFGSGVLDFIYKEPVKEHLQKLEQIAEELHTEYVDGVLLSLAALVPLMYKGRRRPYFPNLKRNNVMNTDEYQLVERHFSDLEESERIYLVIHLLGSRVSVSTAKIEMFENYAEQSVYEITKSLVAEFEKRACVFFEDREGLERALFLHINTSLYRYQYGVQIDKRMTKDIMREYPNVFEITRFVSKYLEQFAGVPIRDSEVAYLTLHFGAHLKTSQQADKQLRILIVCVNGISTGNMIKREVKELLPNARIVGVVSAVDVIRIQEICDLVVSTVAIESIVPVIRVNPILTDYDRRLILRYQQSEKKQRRSDDEKIFDIVKKYVDPREHERLREELEQYAKEQYSGTVFTREQIGLLEGLEHGGICIADGTFQWKEAIRYAGAGLLEKGYINKGYLDKMISQLLYYGPFMFVAQGLVLAHAKPEDGVMHMGISMTIFKEPVAFSEHQKARIIFTLAVEDQEKHLRILKDIMNIFEDVAQVEKIADMNEKEEIVQYLRGMLEG